MLIEREFYLGRLFSAFLIATFLFALVFGIAYTFSYVNYVHVNSQNKYIQEELSGLDKVIANASCDNNTLIAASERLDRVARYLDLLERRLGKNDDRVIHEKELYNQLQLKHYYLVLFMQQQCKRPFETLLFFYSNDPSLIDASEHMGGIIGAFKQRSFGRYMVYSFDLALEDKAVSDLYSNYSLSQIPSLVVNEQDVLYPENIDDLESYFGY